MIDLFKSLIEVLEDIRTPLIFWSFCALLILLGFYIFIKNSKNVEKIPLAIINKLTKAKLYQAFKLSMILLFILLIILVILAFIAPVLNNYLESIANTDQLERKIEQESEQIQEALALEKKYEEIIKLYQKKDYETATLLVEETFEVNKSKASNDLAGYIVASYFGLKEYKKALEEVLERDKLLTVWDYSLLRDYILCVRMYTNENSFMEALDLIDELRNKYKSKLISYVWCSIPIGVFNNLEEGVHRIGLLYLEEEVIINIKYVIKKYPNDPQIEFAYYVLGNYQKASEHDTNNRLRDILLYAKAYKLLRDTWISQGNIQFNAYTKTLSKSSMELSSVRENLNSALILFYKYVEEFPERPHADDSCFWIAWIYYNFGDFETSFKWFDAVQAYGNGDYTGISGSFRDRIFYKELPPEIALQYMKKEETEKSYFYMNYRYLRTIKDIIKRSAFSDGCNIILNEDSKEIKCYLALNLAREKLILLKTDESKIALNLISENDLNQLSENKKEEILLKLEAINSTIRYVEEARAGNVNDYSKAGINLRRYFGSSKASLNIINEGINKYKGKESIDYLIYLKVLACRNADPKRVRSIVNEFLRLYPDSDYIDDALAELVYVQAWVFNDFNEGEKTVSKLFTLYPDRNACDNALNWLALSHLYSINVWKFNPETDIHLEAAKLNYQEIIQRFPTSRFAPYAEANLAYIKGIEKGERKRRYHYF